MKLFVLILICSSLALEAATSKDLIFKGTINSFDEKTLTILTEKKRKIIVPRTKPKFEKPVEGQSVVVSIKLEDYVKLNPPTLKKKK